MMRPSHRLPLLLVLSLANIVYEICRQTTVLANNSNIVVVVSAEGWIGPMTAGPAWKNDLRPWSGDRPQWPVTVVLDAEEIGNLGELLFSDQFLSMYTIATGLVNELTAISTPGDSTAAATAQGRSKRDPVQERRVIFNACTDVAWIIDNYLRIGLFEMGAPTEKYIEILFGLLKVIDTNGEEDDGSGTSEEEEEETGEEEKEQPFPEATAGDRVDRLRVDVIRCREATVRKTFPLCREKGE
eukprot:GHVQ01042613.1.p1 GENE.GHVQ01042613.1~~GHVQ01042613.1.p1  ORF type:complete len:242 (+),score=51.63 GHVQ01042613.1:78-803(+)